MRQYERKKKYKKKNTITAERLTKDVRHTTIGSPGLQELSCYIDGLFPCLFHFLNGTDFGLRCISRSYLEDFFSVLGRTQDPDGFLFCSYLYGWLADDIGSEDDTHLEFGKVFLGKRPLNFVEIPIASVRLLVN